MTLGLYIHFVSPSSTNHTHNGTVAGPETLAAEPSNLLTLIPLVATMFFIMGMSEPHGAYVPWCSIYFSALGSLVQDYPGVIPDIPHG